MTILIRLYLKAYQTYSQDNGTIMKILQVYNSAPHYRASIFKLIDCTFDCDYIFGKDMGDIKQMDISCLKGNVTLVDNISLLKKCYWQKGVQKYLRRQYDTFIILGETRCLSTWLFCIRARMFYRQKRIFFWTHGWYGKENRLESMLKRFFFRLPNAGIFLYGEYAKRLMVKEGFNEQKLYVIHNSLSYERQLDIRQSLHPSDVYIKHFNNNNPNLVFVGRLTKVKNLELALIALQKLNYIGQPCNLTLIGSGEQQEELHSLAARLDLKDIVWFYGPCYDEEQLGHLLYNADLCVSPGNVGLTAMHSMVFGTPVLTHNDFAYQMPEFEAIKEGVTGGFFVRNSVDSLVYALSAWFRAPGYDRELIRRNCYSEIDRYWTPQFQIDVLKAQLLRNGVS